MVFIINVLSHLQVY